jgi:thiamine pyrophosphate-dependent acetolactate synthase large subunit-like protein
MTAADILIDQLYQQGMRVLFGMPGSHTTYIYDALRNHGGFQTFICRNEQAGAYMADGYARVSGEPAIICTTAGPGATNALSGVAEAYADNVPLLLLTGEVNADRLHEECGNYHEIGLEAILKPCNKYVGLIRNPRQIPVQVRDAVLAMNSGRNRPASLIAPQDIMAKEVSHLPPIEPMPFLASTIDVDAIERAALAIGRMTKPIIIAGGGAVWSGCGKQIEQLAERIGAAIVTSLNGKGIVDERNPRSVGHAKSISAKALLPHADGMIAIGCRFTEVLTSFHTMPVPENLVQIDLDPQQIGMSYPVEAGLLGDAKMNLLALLGELQQQPSDWHDSIQQAKQTPHPAPEWFISTMRDMLPEDAIVFSDASEMALRMQSDYPAYQPRTFFYPSNYIALGWGFPAAIGGSVAAQGKRVYSVSGDGGFVMTCQELATVKKYQLNLTIIVHNDSAYGAIKNLQRRKHEARYFDTDLINPDFIHLANSFGIPAKRCPDQASFQLALQESLNCSGPLLIEVPDQWRSLRI